MRVNGSGSPVLHPTVTVGTEVLTVKVSLLAELIISRTGFSFGQLIQSLVPKNNKDPKNTAYLFELWAACVAHNYADAGQPIPTADQWAQKVDNITGGWENSTPFFTEMYAALTSAVVKRWPALNPPAKETPANPPAEDQSLQ